MQEVGFKMKNTKSETQPNQSRDSQIDSNDPKKKVLLFNHGKGGEIEVSMIEDILYKLRPRLYDRNETPRQRVEAVMEAKAALQKIIDDSRIERLDIILGEARKHGEYMVTIDGHTYLIKTLKDNRSSE